MVATPSPLCLVAGRVHNALRIQHEGDALLAVPVQRPLKDLPHHSRRLRLHNEMMFVVRIFLIAVDRKAADVLPLSPLHVKDHADVLGQILQIPLIDESVDLAGFFVALDLGIGVVRYRNKTNAPDGKQRVDVLFYQFHVAGKAGLALAEDNLELLFFRRFNHAVEVRPQTVRAGVILIAVNVVDVPPPLYGVTDEQRFLILDAFRFSLPFVFVLLTQSCINRTKDSYTSFKA